VQPLAISRHEGRTILVLEDPGGEPLDRVLGQSRDVIGFLRIAISLATALGQVHRSGLIHKDIKPAHVIVDAQGRVRLTGFGIASRLPRERQAPAPPEVIAGTLAYMAPEQTGRMNRSMDARSDLYSLGITFYEMLTGTLPFQAADPLEWVHCHIARQPPPPDERMQEIPASLSAIILKLLAKTAEERYQTAAGLEADLRRCEAEWESQGRSDAFPLGAHDVPDRLLIPEKLYGREPEIGALLAAFDRVVASGAPELVLVSGYSGIGKSSVVNELHRGLVPPRGLFASGKFDQYKRDIPYATLAQACQNLVRPLLGQGEAELGPWRDALREALGPNGQLMVDLVPELALVLGPQPPVADLASQDAKNRFQMVFRRFLGVFARSEHPLTLFLDDLQWLDAATLELIEPLVTPSEVGHLLLVGAYRDNEVDASHPLMRTLEAIRAAGGRVQEIVLAPLGLDDVGHLVADALHCEPEPALPLAHLVQEKTGGNPFFAIQFFTALAEDGLLTFAPGVQAWQWDLDRIRARSYTDNVVELMAGKLRRLSAPSQEALKQLACLGNIAEIATLTLVYGETEEAMQVALWEAVAAGLVFQQGSAYTFLHDRIQQAAYSLIPEADRGAVHLHIGRVLLASLTADEFAEHLFEIVNQLNRGAERLIDRDEKAQVATIDLRAGRKAKASAAYASARAYFAAGMALLDEQDWGIQHELKFSLSLELAECELLCGGMEKAAQLIVDLLQRAASDVEFADASCLKINLHVLTGEHPVAIDSAIACLRRLGIDLPAHPTLEQVRAEYETVWQALNGRSIKSLIDLPLMTDPKIQAAMQVLSALAGPATFTDFQLFCLLACRMVNVSIQHGMSGASAYAYACLGSVLGANFHRYREGYRLGRLACDLVEKHGFTAYDTKVSHAMGLAAFWTQPLTSVIELRRATTRTAAERGDLTFACYGMHQYITYLLVRNDPLDVVWRESVMALDFARTAKFRDVAVLIERQQRFISSIQGRDATFSAFTDERFDEAAFEAQLTDARTPTVTCLHWIRKLKARYLSGDYAEAQAAADKAKALLRISAAQLQMLDYFYYSALTMAAVFETAVADKQSEWRELLILHCEQLREWAESNPPTFSDKHALVSAEIAHLEGRDLDAMRLYEQAIQSAREHGFVQNEAVAHEVAARFYVARGLEPIAHLYLRNARQCYLNWGADGKVRQLDQLYPYLQKADPSPDARGAIGVTSEHLDLATVIKVSQAVSGEIVHEKLIDTLLRTALEHAGAERGLLILPRGVESQIEAEASATRDTVRVRLLGTPPTPSELPVSILQYVIRTLESVILEDASAPNHFFADPYLRQNHARSVLCLPLLKQARLIGVLYLENNLAPHVFTPARIAILKLLASQAAISLENTRLYSDLQEREAKIRRLVDANIIGIVIADLDGGLIDANDAFLKMVGYDRIDLVSGRMRWLEMTPPEWVAVSQGAVAQMRATGSCDPYEKEYFRKDGSRVPVLISAAAFAESRDENVAFVLDLTERKRAEEARRESESWRTLTEALPQLVWAATPGGACDYFSTQWTEYTGVPEIELLGWRWMDVLHPDDREPTRQLWMDSVAGRRRYDVEYRVRQCNGVYGWFKTRGTPIRDSEGNIVQWFGTCTDISDRKRAEEALRQSEQELLTARNELEMKVAERTAELRRSAAYLAEAQRLSLTGSFGWNISSGELVWSEQSFRIFEYDPATNPSVGWVLDRVHPDDIAVVRETLECAVHDGKDWDLEHRLLMPDGEVKYVHVVARAVRDESDNLEFVGALMDITARKQGEEALRTAQAELAHVTRVTTIGELTASIAHEVNQPLTAIVTNGNACLRWLAAQPPNLEEAREAVERIIKDGHRASEVIARIRALVKKTPPQKEWLDIYEIILEVIALARSEVQRHRVALQTQFSADLPRVHGDRIQLQQVLLNLIMNGIEAMSGVQPEPRELLVQSGNDGSNRVLIAVRDNGIGLDPKHLAHLFDAFYTTKPTGLGMGLAISRSIIEGHGGRIWAEANAPHGAVFQFTLPVEEERVS
jgi:PAS domain S-box-containing protein